MMTLAVPVYYCTCTAQEPTPEEWSPPQVRKCRVVRVFRSYPDAAQFVADHRSLFPGFDLDVQ